MSLGVRTRSLSISTRNARPSPKIMPNIVPPGPHSSRFREITISSGSGALPTNCTLGVSGVLDHEAEFLDLRA